MSQDSSSPSPPTLSQQKRRHSSRPPPRLSWPAASSNKKPGIKRPRLFSSSSKTKNATSDDAEQGLWIDRYPPSTSSDLCVAPKKVKEIGEWLESASSRRTRKKLLVLVGSPGIGKSSTVRVLCDEKGLSLLSWNEAFVPRSYKTSESNHQGRDNADDDDFVVQQTSAIGSFHEFLQQSSVGLHSLDIIFDQNNSNNSTTKKNNNSPPTTATTNPVILLENLPYLHGQDAESKFRTIMEEHLQRAQVPTVLIFSDVSEGKHRPQDLERLVDPKVLYSDAVTIMQIHPVTKPKMKKVLGQIAQKQGHQLTKTLLEELHHQSGGDIRHAIMNLQLLSTGLQSLPRQVAEGNDRDVKLSTFHALGKLMYAKRVVQDDEMSVLAFDPETILERSDLGVGGSLSFLGYHSLDFFSDVTELSNAFELFSDAATLLDAAPQSRRGMSSFHQTCASSVAGRAIASTNTQPAPNKFRQFSTPKVFDVMKNRAQNQILFDQLAMKLASCHISLPSVISCNDTIVTELLPSMRVIIPNEVEPVVDNLYSIARANTNTMNIKTSYQKEQAILKEQAAILEVDDIEDFDDSTDDENENKSQAHTSNNQIQNSTVAPEISNADHHPQQEEQYQDARDQDIEIIVIDD